jgi:hypothetical protein
LTKSCQAIPLADKERVIHQTRLGATNGVKKAQANAHSERARTSNFPYPTARNGTFHTLGSLNGLNVLAEASRRVGASDDHHPRHHHLHDHGLGDKDMLVDPALENPLKHGAGMFCSLSLYILRITLSD